ncbi:MAG: Rab family GTPase [archaeon]|nr:Rab family GTPase [archaeon]
MTDANADNVSSSSSEYIHSYKLVILGEVAVGKSSIVQRFVNGKFSHLHQPTLGALFLTKQVQSGDRIIKFEIWDTAGQERFHSLAPLYYKNARAAIVVFDVSNSATFDRAQKWVNELLEKANPGIVIALCGNKIDLEERQVNKEDAESYANEIGSFYCEVSAKTNTNIDQMFNQIITKLPKIEINNEDNIKLEEDSNKNESSGGWCTSYCYKS